MTASQSFPEVVVVAIIAGLLQLRWLFAQQHCWQDCHGFSGADWMKTMMNLVNCVIDDDLYYSHWNENSRSGGERMFALP